MAATPVFTTVNVVVLSTAQQDGFTSNKHEKPIVSISVAAEEFAEAKACGTATPFLKS